MKNPNYFRNGNLKIAATLLGLGSLAACTTADIESSNKVRGFGWVDAITPIEQNIIGSTKYTDTCVVDDGSELIINENNIATVVDPPLEMYGVTGTTCPEGARFKMTSALQSKLEEAKLNQQKFTVNVIEANKLSEEPGSPIDITGWFETVNKPEQSYRSISSASGVSELKMDLGEACLVQENIPVILLGRLSTGDYAARVERKDTLGTSCPEGTVLIVPSANFNN